MKKTIYIILVVLASLCFWSAARVHYRLKSFRETHNLNAVSLENAPPLVSFATIALGGFRGIIADALWLRIARLQQEGKFFEIVQLADWITVLEPHFTTVWAFHAWNMAYNISILFPDPEDRWRWINNGISLLRDGGLKCNPDDPQLYRELGWLYQHKLGWFFDPEHRYYKFRLAQEMTQVLGGPGPDYLAPSSRLQDEYELSAKLMQAVDKQYGPLDWRLPASHAIYWACRGLRLAPRSPSTKECDLMIFQCMAQEFRSGWLYFDPRRKIYITLPRFDLLPKVLQAYEGALSRHDNDLFKKAYANFLSEAVFYLYCFDRTQQCLELRAKLMQLCPWVRGGDGLASFIGRQLAANVKEWTVKYAVFKIDGYLVQRYNADALGENNCAKGFELMAQLFWRHCAQSFRGEGTPFPSLPELRRQAFQRVLADLRGADNLVARLKACAPAQ